MEKKYIVKCALGRLIVRWVTSGKFSLGHDTWCCVGFGFKPCNQNLSRILP